jgi:hypothetical protein
MTRRDRTSPLQHPAPSAGALAERRARERLQATNTRICNSTSGKAYAGEELRPYANRPGALDAYALPSLHGGRRSYLPLHRPRGGGVR